MKNKIDQFFQNKLEAHKLPHGEQIWAKVEANLSKKNNLAVWRIAAAIFITGTLVWVIIWSQRDTKNNEPLFASKNSPKDFSIKEKPTAKISSVERKKDEIARSKTSSTNPHSSQTNKTIFHQKEVPPSAVETKEIDVAMPHENIPEEKINSKATPATTIASTKQKSIKLEFTLEDITSEQPVADVSEEKSSGLKKVWDLAREVKNGDGPVRGIKNEIFALNFKKNKIQ